MKTERVLSLDISSKTGWALLISSPTDLLLETHGQIPKTSEPDGRYPSNYVIWAYQIFGDIVQLIDRLCPDVLVIEETASGSKNAYSQKILEYTHFLLAKLITESGIKSIYYLTDEWRRIVGSRMNKEEAAHNKVWRTAKKTAKTQVIYDSNGKRIGKIGKKHLNVRRANEVFGKFLTEPLKLKDEDTADSLLLGYCYHLKKLGS